LEKATVNGIEIAFDRKGSGAELLVFIHGVGADRTAWTSQLDYFAAQGYTAVAIDMRGSGESQSRFATGEAVPISIADFASDVNALILHLGFSKAHWIGNSMGGVIILHALQEKFATVDKVGICNSFARHPQSAEILPRAANALRTKSLAEFAAERIPLMLRKDTDSMVLEAAIHAMARKDPETYLASWKATWSPDYRESLKYITRPTLIISSDQDQATPVALSQELAGNIPGAKHVTIEAAGHISNLDNQERFNSEVLQFLRPT
jgi:3-oxoadipate enol-lactonase